MTITLHQGDGTRQAVNGELTEDWDERFNAAEVSAFLSALTKAVTDDPKAVISVTSHLHTHSTPAGWAWHIADGTALDADAAAPLFPKNVLLKGAAELYVTLSGLVDTSEHGLSATALTGDVRGIVTAHAAR
ncbi:hypothetical protein ACWGQ5_56290 [Streptomyces sp. NPDC055722]